MSELNLTEGARRALARAAAAANEWFHDEVQPAHLLWALLEEESLACESLLEAGITTAGVLAADIWGTSRPPEAAGNCEDETLAALTRDVSSALNLHVVRVDPVESEALQQVQFHARSIARVGGSEVGTEHLLTGLMAVDQSIASLLEGQGVQSEPQHLAAAFAEVLADPVPVAFEIDVDQHIDADRTSACRIIDAAANRAREGLRVVEDYVRFTLDDAHLSRLLKTARHQFSAVTQLFDERGLIASRDTRQDVGTGIHTASEMSRGTALDVARASLKRVQEAARTLEEFTKVVVGPVPPDELPLPERIGQFRYELYSLEKAVLTTIASRQRLRGCSLYLLLTSDFCADGLEDVLNAATSNGVGIVQLREKSLSDRELLKLARHVRQQTRDAGVLFIMNDRPDLAVLCEADGVHVGQDELSVRDVRRIVGPDRLIGVSTHEIDQARAAVLDGADYLGVGPVFTSQTKSFDEFAGLEYVKEIASEISLPWFAIGGISSANLVDVMAAGASRVAVSGAVCGSESPGQATADLVGQLASG